MSARHFTVVRLILLALYMAMLLHSHAFSLPYIDHPDEPSLYLAGQVWIGAFEMGSHMRGYPPAYLALELGIAQLLRALGFSEMSQTINVMRWIAMLVSGGTLWLIFSAAREAAGDWASLLAGITWLTAPIVVSHSVYATTDPVVCFAMAWSLWLSIVALRRERPHWALIGMGVGAMAVLVKFMVVPSLLAGVTALLFWLRDRKLGMRLLAGQLAIVSITAFLLFGVLRTEGQFPYEDPNPDAEVNLIQREGVQSMLYNLANARRVLNNIGYVFVPVRDIYGIAVPLWLLSGAIAWLMARSARIDWRVILLCLIGILAVPWIMASFTEIGLQRIRDVLPAVTALCVLLGIAAAQVWRALPRKRLFYWLYGGAVALWIGLAILPNLMATLALVSERAFPDRRVELRQWADASLEAGWVAVPHSYEKVFNPFWSGLKGAQWFDWLNYGHTFGKEPLSYWRDQRGVLYIILPADQVLRDSRMNEYLAQMLPLKAFLNPPYRRGEEVFVYRTVPIQTPLEANFGDQIALLGMDLRLEAESLRVRLYWRAQQPPQRDYSLYLHLTPLASRQILAQQDGPPKARRPTSSWQDTDERLIGDWFTLNLSEACDVRLIAGLYDSATGERLRLPDGADYVELWRKPCANF
jgi:4-amino-4-deoxy-L-arabinose transferase-like glycosyltransferase